MFDLSPDKIVVLGILALVVLGPNRLPDAARTAGRFLGQMRRMSAGFQTEVRDALSDPADAFNSVVTEFRVPDVRRSVRHAISSTFSPDAPPEVQPRPAAPPPPPARDGIIAPGTPDDPSFN